MSRETKTLQFKVKATGVTTDENGDRLGHLEIYGAAFNNVDEGNDRINKGAFARTIQNSKARAKARDKKYALKMLWQHDTNEIIGGWQDLSEDNEGLRAIGDVALKTRRGAEFYELAELEMIDEFSIIYEVMPGGAKYDKSGVRDLTELRLFSIDPVTFPMNDDPHIIKIKSLEQKSICGNTSGPIGPRDEAWSGSKAEKQIWDVAYDEDSGKVKAATAKKYFMVVDGDGSKKGDYSYPFWYVGDSPHISVGAVKAIAGAIGGARGANAPDGLKGKVETLYKRINAKYPDDPQLSLDDGKSARRHMDKKDFNTLFMAAQAQDALEDWCDLVDTLTQAMMQAFCIGDEPQGDMSAALEQFGAAVDKWTSTAMECGLPDYMSDRYGYGDSEPTPYLPYNMRVGGYNSMSRHTPTEQKAGRSISAANQGSIDDHVAGLHDMADKTMKDMKANMKAVHDAADAFAEKMAGNQADSDNPDETPIEKSYETALRALKTLTV